MNIYNYTELRQNLKQVLDKVVDDCDGVLIKRRDAEDAVIMSKSHYDSLMETFYLLKSPANAKHLMDAIAEDKAGKIEYHDLIEERPRVADRRKRGVRVPPCDDGISPLGMRDEEEE